MVKIRNCKKEEYNQEEVGGRDGSYFGWEFEWLFFLEFESVMIHRTYYDQNKKELF